MTGPSTRFGAAHQDVDYYDSPTIDSLRGLRHSRRGRGVAQKVPPHAGELVPFTETLMRRVPLTPALGKITEGAINGPREILVAHNKVRVAVAASQSDPLVDPGVQFGQAAEHVAHVQHGLPLGVDLVEHKVAEQLDHVAVPVLGPPRVSLKLEALVNDPELHHQPRRPPVLDLAVELRVQGVRLTLLLIKGRGQVVVDARQEVIYRLARPWLRRVQQPQDRLLERHRVVSAHLLDGGGQVETDGQRVRGQRDNHLAERDKVLLPQVSQRLRVLEVDNVEDTARAQSYPVLVRQDDLAEIHTAGSEVRRVDRPQRVGDLHNVAPQDTLCGRNRVTELALLSTGEVMLSQRFRERVVVLRKYEGAVAERPVCEGVVKRHNVSVADLLPLLDRSQDVLVGHLEALQAPQAVHPARLARDGLVHPACVAKHARRLAGNLVKWNKGVVVGQLGKLCSNLNVI